MANGIEEFEGGEWEEDLPWVEDPLPDGGGSSQFDDSGGDLPLVDPAVNAVGEATDDAAGSSGGADFSGDSPLTGSDGMVPAGPGVGGEEEPSGAPSPGRTPETEGARFRNRGFSTGAAEVADLLDGRPKSVPSGVRAEVRAEVAGAGEGELDRDDFYKMTPEEERWLSELPPDETRSIEDDWEWVTLHLDNKWLRVQEIPHQRAWSMLKWARKGPGRTHLYTRIMEGVGKSRAREGASGADGGGGERDELDRVSAEELRAMLEEAIEESLRTRMVKGGGLELAKRGKRKKVKKI